MSEVNISKGMFAYALFCDDIRYEFGNKVSLIGTYKTYMYVNDFPTFIPRLAIQAILSSPYNGRIESLSLQVMRDEEVLIDIESSEDDLKGGDFVESESVENPKRVEHGFYVQLPPLTINGPCELKVHLVVDGERIIAGRLIVKKPPQDSGMEKVLQ